MKWLVYSFMDNYNPVCTDAGELIIRVNPDGSPFFVADGIAFAPYEKQSILEFGFTGFSPFLDVDGSEIGYDYKKPLLDKNGQLVSIDNEKNPITTDPRVLMIMHHYHHHGLKAMTKVPTRLEAVNYLIKENALYPLIPLSMCNEKRRPLSLADLETQGLLPEMI